MKQLSLFESMPEPGADQSVQVRNMTLRNATTGNEPPVHGIVKNPTARGIYYSYWWNAGFHPFRRTKKRPIRGGRVGSVLGEHRRQQVEGMINRGSSPQEICAFLESLPRSVRRARLPIFQLSEVS